jgi:predicted nucleic-acid-binding Zn-ribbon protein
VAIRDGICPRCQHDEIVQAAASQRLGIGLEPLAVTHQRPDGSTAPALFGPFNIYVCRRCGYTEWYAIDPDKIPIGDEYYTRLIKRPASGPYR